MTTTAKINRILQSTFGINIKKASRHPEVKRHPSLPELLSKRNLKQPVFIFSSVRSGSTLLSSLLNAHTEMYSPPETRFSVWGVSMENSTTAQLTAKEFGLTRRKAQYILWDAVLSRMLEQSRKRIFVEKTPKNVFKWKYIMECWPDAKIIFLERHPLSMAQSWSEGHTDWSIEKSCKHILKHANAIEEARAHIKNSVTIKYEDLIKAPETTLQELCDFIGVEYEAAMIDYAANTNVEDRYKKGIGDWTDKIKSGRIQKGRSLPKKSQIPDELKPICKAWGYIK